MPAFSDVITSKPLALSRSTESQVYGLFALALGLTVVGIYAGIQFAFVLLGSGMHVMFLIAELVLIVTARLWMRATPWNHLLFAAFPLLSGITITPYILYILTGYANGGVILMNAASATVFMSLAAAIFARTTQWNLGVLSRGLLFALIGLIVLGLLQIFIPGMRSTAMELLISGAGIMVFGVYTAMDLQRISALGRAGMSPFLLALSLYLDIFNLFLSILRFMVVLYGNRR